jgi:hypothetical protein
MKFKQGDTIHHILWPTKKILILMEGPTNTTIASTMPICSQIYSCRVDWDPAAIYNFYEFELFIDEGA